MKIAFFTETYLPNRDGVVSSIVSTRKELENSGNEVYVFAPSSPQSKENKDPRVFYHRAASFKPYPQYKLALFPFSANGKLKEIKPQVIHTHGMATMGLAAIRASRSFKLPLVGTFHTLIPQLTHYISKRRQIKNFTEGLAWSYMKWYFSFCKPVIAPSFALKAILEQHGIGNVEVIPSGVNTKRFNPSIDGSQLRAKLGFKEDEKVVLHLGRLVHEKNLDILINSALLILEEDPATKFLVVGDGPARTHYSALVKKHGLEKRFIFTGLVPDNDVPKYCALADALVFPSKIETQGLVALEAMACGTPVAGANYLAIPEVVKDNYNGFLFNPDSAEECASAILKTAKSKEKFSKNCIKTADSFSVSVCTEKLLKLYTSLQK
ncbi:MAG: glycosyltransferase [Candidatus Micrarchaeota archaeon]